MYKKFDRRLMLKEKKIAPLLSDRQTTSFVEI